MSALDDALAMVLRYEGGYVNNPDDHGGATNHGVTQAVYSAWRAEHGLGQGDVKSIKPEEVAAIYRRGYWDACACDRLPHPVGVAVFDAAVNSGPSQSSKWLQRAVGVPADGAIGPRTISATVALDPKTVTRSCIDQREAFMRSLAERPGQAQFLRGWLHRLADLRQVCGV